MIYLNNLVNYIRKIHADSLIKCKKKKKKKKIERKKVRRVIQHDLKKNFTPIKIPLPIFLK